MNTLFYLFTVIFLILLIVTYPLIMVATTQRISGRKKLVWFVFTLIFSWPVYILFLLVT